MLGRTNITTVEKDNIVSNIEEYIWKNAGLNGVSGTFVKTIYENDTIVGITKDGMIAHTKDGENWEVTGLDLEDRYELSDIIWDGSRYVMVGFKTEGELVHGLIAISEDLLNFSISIEEASYCSKYFTILKKDSRYILISAESGIAGNAGTSVKFMSRVGDLSNWESEVNIPIDFPTSSNVYRPEYFDRIYVEAAKKSNGFLVYLKYPIYSTTSMGHYIYASQDGMEFVRFSKQGTNTGDKLYNQQIASVFESKDSLYFLWLHTDFNYGLHKIIGIGEEAVMTTGTNFAFVDAVYFNKCEVFINNHEMLVIKPGESIVDKTLEDFVEITYDFSMTSIVKAFGKLYVFGSGGKVLVSSDEVENEESNAVKTMSAAKALYDAKAYTDKKCRENSIDLKSGRQISFEDGTFKLADYCTTVTDWNNADKNGWYMAANAEHSPAAKWLYGFVIAHNDKFARQILYRFGDNDNVNSIYSDRYERIKHNGVWGEWVNTSVNAELKEKISNIESVLEEIKSKLGM